MRTSILFSLSIALGALLTLVAWDLPTPSSPGGPHGHSSLVGVVAWGASFTDQHATSHLPSPTTSARGEVLPCCRLPQGLPRTIPLVTYMTAVGLSATITFALPPQANAPVEEIPEPTLHS